jgi:hypothetical protein
MMTAPQTRRVPPPPDATIQHPPASSAQTLLRHAREGTIELRGPSSGQIYRFSSQAATAVLAQDVGALLRTGALVHANR